MHFIPWRVIFFLIIPAVLILWKVLSWAHAKDWGFRIKSIFNTVILGCCYFAAPFSLVVMDHVALWLLSDSKDSDDMMKVDYM